MVHVLFLLICAGLTPVLGEIIKGPYLQNVQTDSITVMWESDRPTTGVVQYGKTSDYGLRAIEAEPSRIHEIRLSNLEIETGYHYRVLSGSDSSPDRTFQTAVHPDSPFKFVYYGDNKNGPHMHRRNARRISSEEPNLVFQCGDLVNEGHLYSQWERLFFTPARPLIDHIPIYPTLGNHERNAEHYFQYFSLPNIESWYSMDYGNTHFVVLNSNPDFLTEDSEQLKWLIEDLQKSRATWKFVSFHHPPFTSGGNYYTSRRIVLKNLLHPIFEQYGVDIVFNGHDHNYERIRPIVSRKGKRAVTYVVNGNGGTPLRYVGKRSWTVHSQRVFGYTLVRIHGPRLELEGKTVDGDIIDRLVIDKGNPALDQKYLDTALSFESIVDPIEAIRLAEEGEELVEQVEEWTENDPGRVGADDIEKVLLGALEKFQRAFELDPSFCEALVEMGKINRKLGRVELAVDQFKKALDLMPVYPDSYEELLEIYTDGGEYEKAMRVAREWAKIEPDQTDPMEAVAEIYEEQGKIEEAIVALGRASKIVPSDSDVYIDLAELYERIGLAEEAEKHWREAMKWIDAEETEELQKILEQIQELLAADH